MQAHRLAVGISMLRLPKPRPSHHVHRVAQCDAIGKVYSTRLEYTRTTPRCRAAGFGYSAAAARFGGGGRGLSSPFGPRFSVCQALVRKISWGCSSRGRCG